QQALPAGSRAREARDAAVDQRRAPAAPGAGRLGLRRPHRGDRSRHRALRHVCEARAPRALPRRQPVRAFPVPRASRALQRAAAALGGVARMMVFIHGGVPGVTPYASGPHIWGDQDGEKVTVTGRTVDAMTESVRKSLKGSCHLVGHDLGGLIAFNLAIESPQLVSAVTAVASVAAAPSGD